MAHATRRDRFPTTMSRAETPEPCNKFFAWDKVEPCSDCGSDYDHHDHDDHHGVRGVRRR